MPTYFISDAAEMTSPGHIRHFNIHRHEIEETDDWLPDDRPLDIVLTAGASCPDALLDEVVVKLLDWFPGARSIEDVVREIGRASCRESGWGGVVARAGQGQT